MEDPACRIPAAKTTTPIVAAVTPKRRWNQKTTKVVTTNPPAKASSPKSAASLITVGRDRWHEPPERGGPAGGQGADRSGEEGDRVVATEDAGALAGRGSGHHGL